MKLNEIREILKKKNDYWWNIERKDLELKFYVPTDILLGALADYEMELPKEIVKDFEKQEKNSNAFYFGWETYFENNKSYKKVQCGNSYNWDGKVQNDFEYDIFKDLETEKYIVLLRVHLGGDIRTNYTDTMFFEFDSDYDFFELLNDIGNENNLSFDITVNDREFVVTPLVLSDRLDIYDTTSGENIDTIYASDTETLIADLQEYMEMEKKCK